MNKEIQQAIQDKYLTILRLESEVLALAKEHIPDFHFLDHKVSNFWTCEKSPIGWCVFYRHEITGAPTSCRYCGGPVERK